MYNVLTLNKIAKCGTDILGDNYTVSDNETNPVAVLVRSASMHEMEMPESLLAIARAGAGVNNIPIKDCAEKGIVVFNSPGANANAVKELVVAGLLMSSRKIVNGIEWAKTLKGNGDQVGKMVEKGKSNFAGPEIMGKTLGVIGLGAIGIKVANVASALGMKVVGCDPFLNEANKAKLVDCKIVETNDEVYAEADYITVHVPLNDGTRGMINKETISKMKDGVILVNTSRGGLIKTEDLIAGIKNKKVGAACLDVYEEEGDFFYEDYSGHIVRDDKLVRLIAMPNVIVTSHQAFLTQEALDSIASTTVDNLVKFFAGTPNTLTEVCCSAQ